MKDDYKDIICLKHPTSKTRPRMTVYNRAAQFAPFAALTGHDQAVKETARLTYEQAQLDEYQIEIINRKLNIALSQKHLNPVISITFFKPDYKKKGGEYITLSGVIKRIDEISHSVVMKDGSVIPINFIYDINVE